MTRSRQGFRDSLVFLFLPGAERRSSRLRGFFLLRLSFFFFKIKDWFAGHPKKGCNLTAIARKFSDAFVLPPLLPFCRPVFSFFFFGPVSHCSVPPALLLLDPSPQLRRFFVLLFSFLRRNFFSLLPSRFRWQTALLLISLSGQR